MARLKKDHSGWRSSGLHMKYQSPKINERPVKAKSKKDTTKWCRGKKGVEHDLYRTPVVYSYWDYEKVSRIIETKCFVCKKKFYGKHKEVPFYPYIKNECTTYPVQVKVNGLPIPIDPHRFDTGAYYCNACSEWHY